MCLSVVLAFQPGNLSFSDEHWITQSSHRLCDRCSFSPDVWLYTVIHWSPALLCFTFTVTAIFCFSGCWMGEGNWTCYTAPFPSGPHPPWVCNTGFLYQNMCAISCFYSSCNSASLTFLMLYTRCVHPCSLSMGAGFTRTGIVFLPIKIKYVHFTYVPLCFILFKKINYICTSASRPLPWGMA